MCIRDRDREERLAVGAGEHELVLVTHEEQVVAHEIGIDVSDDRSRLAQVALERGEEQGERGRSLLAVDDGQARDPARVIRVDRVEQGTHEVRVGRPAGAKNVAPELVALVLAPRIHALEHGDRILRVPGTQDVQEHSLFGKQICLPRCDCMAGIALYS